MCNLPIKNSKIKYRMNNSSAKLEQIIFKFFNMENQETEPKQDQKQESNISEGIERSNNSTIDQKGGKSIIRQYYESIKNEINYGYDFLKEKITQRIDSSFIGENFRETQEKWDKVKQNIDKIDLEIKKITKLKNYFFEGALIGSTMGLLYGLYKARRKQKYLKIPISTIGFGLSFGIIFACVPMVQQQPDAYKKLSKYKCLNERQTMFWLHKCLGKE